MRKTTTFTIMAMAVIATSCATAKIPAGLPKDARIGMAEPEEPKTPLETVMYDLPDVKTLTRDTTEKASSTATEKATVRVRDASEFENAIAEYNYADGNVYQVCCGMGFVTDVRLEPGESVTGDTAIGDASRWLFSSSTSTEGGLAIQHIFVKPLSSGISTTMVIPTDRRTYYIELLGYESLHMTGVRWNYPTEGTVTAKGITAYPAVQAVTASDASQINLRYAFSGGKKSLPWHPVSAYDDGVRSYIQFDPRFSTNAGAPSLYLVQDKSKNLDKVEVVNYRVKGNVYIIDFVLAKGQSFLLVAGDDKVFVTGK